MNSNFMYALYGVPPEVRAQFERERERAKKRAEESPLELVAAELEKLQAEVREDEQRKAALRAEELRLQEWEAELANREAVQNLLEEFSESAGDKPILEVLEAALESEGERLHVEALAAPESKIAQRAAALGEREQEIAGREAGMLEERAPAPEDMGDFELHFTRGKSGRIDGPVLLTSTSSQPDYELNFTRNKAGRIAGPILLTRRPKAATP
jgi:transketolase